VVLKKVGIFRQIADGVRWNFIGQIAGQIVSLGTFFILARLLNPEDFGLVAMTYTVKTFATIFSNLGMNTAVIQRKDINDTYISTAFWTTIFSGTVVSLLFAASGPLFAIFFKKEELVLVIAVMSSTFILGSLSSTFQSILTRRMDFKHISIVNFIGQLSGALLAIILALKGMKYWCLVYQDIFATLVVIPFFWKLSGWKIKFKFEKKCFKDLFGFSSFLLFENIINYFNRNGDNIIIGRFLGASQLGIYDRAYTLMLKPLQYISFAVGRTLFPALSQIQDDKEQVREIYLRIVKMISLITFPMMIGLFVLSRDVIILVLGPKWEAVVPVFSILCFVGLFQSIGTTVGNIYYSQGRSKLAFKMACIASPFIWLSFIIGIKWGITGVALCYAIVSGVYWLFSHAVANYIIQLRMWNFLQALLPGLFYSLIMGLIIFLVQRISEVENLSLILRLILLTFTGLAVYSFFIAFSRDRDIIVIKKKIFKIFRIKDNFSLS
jgi:O-antigen/teichoic acid export membrane protein